MPPTKSTVFKTTQRLEKAYAQGIQSIVRRVLKPIGAGQDLESWLQELADRTRHADVQEASDLLARRMVFWTNTKNVKGWRAAAAKSQRSRELYRLLQREMQGGLGVKVQGLIQDNAKYISSVPLDAAQTLVHEVRAAQQAGARPATMTKMLRTRFPELLKSRVHLISRTETAKASLALTQARCEDLDLPCYIWRTSKDARVRDSHRLMDGVLVFWRDPPSPEALDGVKSTLGHYHAGGAPNDRCTQEVVLSIDDINWPRKVYHDGSIHQMTKPQFKERFSIVGIESRAA